MIVVQLAVVKACVRYRRSGKRSSVLAGDSYAALGQFWKWRTFPPYVLFVLGLAAILTALHAVAGANESYVEAIGTVALAIEAAVPLPQAIQNHKLKSVDGFRWVRSAAHRAGATQKAGVGWGQCWTNFSSVSLSSTVLSRIFNILRRIAPPRFLFIRLQFPHPFDVDRRRFVQNRILPSY
ncbi:MAG: hypothetical protein BJ554DRAFT_1972 [Olpidium bornovanus]|uniref:Uncharacterized protein n=1 Tax=Olpidium bornovanus TaxID=278681 RepID=A0A8H7ZR69_9FUNG|nr:MAG: hypothetical protein BJ554DRAFT_1972 [Olpidium bornovanus]